MFSSAEFNLFKPKFVEVNGNRSFEDISLISIFTVNVEAIFCFLGAACSLCFHPLFLNSDVYMILKLVV